MNKKLRTYWPTALTFVVLFLLYCFNYKNINGLAIIYDEFGYWGNAATMAGYNWKALLAVTPFYSMGYSMTLVPLFKLGLDLPTMYRIAILMNMGYVCISYLCAMYISGKLFPKLDVRLRQLACFACVASVAMLYNSQIAWCESFLTMLMWCLVALFIRLEYKWTYAAMPAIILDITMIYLTHQRAILLIPLTIGILAVICIQNKKYFSVVFTVLFAFLCLVGYRYLHKWQEEAVYSASEMVMTNGNNVALSSSLIGGFLGRLLIYPKEIIISFLCKVGVIMLTTFFTAAIAYKSNLLRFLRRDFAFWGSRCFILLSALVMLLLQSIQMFGDGRKDLVIYSRYMDYAIFPLALLGLCEFLENHSQYKNLYMFSILFCIPLFILTAYTVDKIDAQYIEPGTPLWGSLIERYGINNMFTVGGVMIEISLVILIAYKLFMEKNMLQHMCAFLLLIMVFQLVAYQYITNKTIRTRRKEYNNVIEDYEILKDYPDDTIYWLLPMEDKVIVDIQFAGELQAMLYDHSMYTLEKPDNLKAGDFVFTSKIIDDESHFETIIDSDYKLYRYRS